MLQPVVPYAIVGLALGSLLKRPGTGALVGSVVGLARTTASPSGVAGFGSFGSVDMKNAPTVAPTIAQARLAAGYGYKMADEEENRGWSPKQIATEWPGAPWNARSTSVSVLRAAIIAVRGKPNEKLAVRYLDRVKKATQKLPMSEQEFQWKFKHAPIKQAAYTAESFKKYFEAKTGKKLVAPKKSRRRTPVQGPRGDTKQYISASGGVLEGTQWWKSTGGKVGIASLAAAGALVLVLMFTGKKK